MRCYCQPASSQGSESGVECFRLVPIPLPSTFHLLAPGTYSPLASSRLGLGRHSTLPDETGSIKRGCAPLSLVVVGRQCRGVMHGQRGENDGVSHRRLADRLTWPAPRCRSAADAFTADHSRAHCSPGHVYFNHWAGFRRVFPRLHLAVPSSFYVVVAYLLLARILLP
jgi:hypothetical protein